MNFQTSPFRRAVGYLACRFSMCRLCHHSNAAHAGSGLGDFCFCPSRIFREPTWTNRFLPQAIQASDGALHVPLPGGDLRKCQVVVNGVILQECVGFCKTTYAKNYYQYSTSARGFQCFAGIFFRYFTKCSLTFWGYKKVHLFVSKGLPVTAERIEDAMTAKYEAPREAIEKDAAERHDPVRPEHREDQADPFRVF